MKKRGYLMTLSTASVTSYTVYIRCLVCLTLLLLHVLLTPVHCIGLAPVYWNMSNPIFKSSKNDHIIDVEAFDQIDFICPYYDQQDLNQQSLSSSHGASSLPEYYLIYRVSKREYDNCAIYPDKSTLLLLNCSQPEQKRRFTILFEPFQSIPNVLEYRPGQSYHFISPSAGGPEGLTNQYRGACYYHNMKLTVRVRADPLISQDLDLSAWLYGETSDDDDTNTMNGASPAIDPLNSDQTLEDLPPLLNITSLLHISQSDDDTSSRQIQTGHSEDYKSSRRNQFDQSDYDTSLHGVKIDQSEHNLQRDRKPQRDKESGKIDGGRVEVNDRRRHRERGQRNSTASSDVRSDYWQNTEKSEHRRRPHLHQRHKEAESNHAERDVEASDWSASSSLGGAKLSNSNSQAEAAVRELSWSPAVGPIPAAAAISSSSSSRLSLLSNIFYLTYPSTVSLIVPFMLHLYTCLYVFNHSVVS